MHKMAAITDAEHERRRRLRNFPAKKMQTANDQPIEIITVAMTTTNSPMNRKELRGGSWGHPPTSPEREA